MNRTLLARPLDGLERALVDAGPVVAMGDLEHALAEREAKRLGPRARGFALDVTDSASLAAFLVDAQAASKGS